MKEVILKFLLDNTHTEGRYIGGGDEPQLVVITNSEDWEKESCLNNLVDRIIVELNSKYNEDTMAMGILRGQIEFNNKMNSNEQLLDKFQECISDLEKLSDIGTIQGYEDNILDYKQTLKLYK